MECGRSETFLIDIGKRAHRAAVAYTQKIKIVWMLAILAQKQNRI
jgi:hypothetical protein